MSFYDKIIQKNSHYYLKQDLDTVFFYRRLSPIQACLAEWDLGHPFN